MINLKLACPTAGLFSSLGALRPGAGLHRFARFQLHNQRSGPAEVIRRLFQAMKPMASAKS